MITDENVNDRVADRIDVQLDTVNKVLVSNENIDDSECVDVSEEISGDTKTVTSTTIENTDNTKKDENPGGIFNIYKNIKVTKRGLDIFIVVGLIALVVTVSLLVVL